LGINQSKKRGECSYHLCDKKQVEVYKCKYCNEYFCKDHIKAKKPMVAPFRSTDFERQMEWKDKTGHPCLHYLEHIIQKEKQMKHEDALKSMPIVKHFSKKTRHKLTEPEIWRKDKPIPELEGLPDLENNNNEETKNTKEEEKLDKKLVTCDKCGRKIPEKEARKTYSTKDGTIISCSSCYSFGNKDLDKSADTKQEPKSIWKQKGKNYLKKIKNFFISNRKPLYKHPNKVISWFFSKKKPWSKLRYEEFGVHFTVFICSLFLFWMIQANLGQLNELKLLFIKTGSLVLLILFFVIIWAVYRLLKNLKYGIRGLANGYKTIASIVAIIFCFYLFLHPTIAINPITSFDYDSLNPLEIEWNFNYTDTNDNTNDYYDWNDDSSQDEIFPVVDIVLLELEIHDLINSERQNNGLSTLEWDSDLADIARDHSQDMVDNNFFSHENLVGQDPTDRAKAAGYNCYKNFGSYYTDGIAENIALTPTGNVIGCGDVHSMQEIAECTVDGWMMSPGHRENILTSTYDKEGIGVAVTGYVTYYITQDFW